VIDLFHQLHPCAPWFTLLCYIPIIIGRCLGSLPS
jgi:hypothetical protein